MTRWCNRGNPIAFWTDSMRSFRSDVGRVQLVEFCSSTFRSPWLWSREPYVCMRLRWDQTQHLIFGEWSQVTDLRRLLAFTLRLHRDQWAFPSQCGSMSSNPSARKAEAGGTRVQGRLCYCIYTAAWITTWHIFETERQSASRDYMVAGHSIGQYFYFWCCTDESHNVHTHSNTVIYIMETFGGLTPKYMGFVK